MTFGVRQRIVQRGLFWGKQRTGQGRGGGRRKDSVVMDDQEDVVEYHEGDDDSEHGLSRKNSMEEDTLKGQLQRLGTNEF